MLCTLISRLAGRHQVQEFCGKNVYHFNYTSNNRDYKIKLLSMVQPGTKVLITTECIINKPQQILEKFNLLIVVLECLLSVGTGFPELGW